MREVFITCFAFLLTLTVGHGGETYYKDDIFDKSWRQRSRVSLLRKVLLQTHPFQQPIAKKWTTSEEDRAKFPQTYLSIALRANNEKQNNLKRDQEVDKLFRRHNVMGLNFDRKPRPHSSLHNKEIERFREVLRTRMKDKPRQDIEFIEDSQDNGARQYELESPRYDEVVANGNSENEDQNGLSNNYVTVIDNIDGKDTDSYNTLGSNEAKLEYTNVANSLNEGENEEFQMVGKEVNDVLGALTKSDSRISQVIDTHLPQAQGELSSNQVMPSYGDKQAENGTIMENGRQKQNDQTPLPGEVTIIEDDEMSPNDEETRPVLSKPIWDAIKQAEKNVTQPYRITQTVGATQYFDKTVPFPTQENKNNTLHNTGSAQQVHTNVTRQHNTHNWHVTNGENKNRTFAYLPPSKKFIEKNNLTLVRHFVGNLEKNLKIFAGLAADDHNLKTEPKPTHANVKDHVRKFVLTGSAEEGPDKTTAGNKNNHLGDLTPGIKSNNLTLEKNIFHTRWHLHHQNDISNSASVGNSSRPLPSGSGTFKVNDSTKNIHKTDGKYRKPGIQMALPLKINGPTRTKDGDGRVSVGYLGTPDVGRRPNSEYVVQFPGKKVNARPLAKTKGSNHFHMSTTHTTAQTSGKGTGTVNDKVTITDAKPLSLEPSVEETFQAKVAESPIPPGKPYLESLQGMGTQRKERLSLKIKGNQFNNPQYGGWKFPWNLANHQRAKEVSLHEMNESSTNEYMKKIQHMQLNGRQRNHDRPLFVSNEDQNKNKDPIKSFVGVPLQLAPHQNVRNPNKSLSRWHEEYEKLIEKLRDLYGQAHGNSLPAQSASFKSNPVLNDTQQMMKEVSRFHSLFASKYGDQKETRRENGMFLKNLKSNVNERNWRYRGHMRISEDPSYNYGADPGKNKDVSNHEVSSLSFEKNREVSGQIRSIQAENQTLFGLSNSEDMFKQAPNNTDVISDKIQNEFEGSERGHQSDVSTTFVNQRLTSQHRSIPTHIMNMSATGGDGVSSHLVLMSYFGNETDLRKQLHFSDDFGNGSNTSIAPSQGEENQLENNKTSKISNDMTKESTPKLIVQDGTIDNISGIRKQNKSDALEEESLKKYLEDFISLLSSDGAAERNETAKDVSESESGLKMSSGHSDPIMAAEASKKENVTDLKDRVIIVVSPQSIKEIMKNRSHNSQQPVVHKGIPIKAATVENSTITLMPNLIANKSREDFKEHFGNVTSMKDPTTQSKDFKRPSLVKVINKTSNEDKDKSKIRNDDLNELYKEELKSLEISLSRDFMNSWIYYQRSLDEIGITPRMLRSGIANLGSPQRLKRVFKKALTGSDLNVLVVGGSISAGGGLEKDRGNVEGVYHKAFSDWWNNTVTPITTSELKISAVAIGGTDSEYFSYCIQNYMRFLPDIVIWELAANDYKRYAGREFAPAKPLEQLIRIILSLPSKPALILANFFRGNYYKTAEGQDCPDSEDEGGKSIAQYYKLTSLSWRNVICSRDKELDLKKLFSSDGYHPSLLGHAQMSTLLISYIKGVFEETISEEMTLLRNHTPSREKHEIPPSLAEPIFDDPVSPKPLCWTLLTPDYGQKLRNTLPDLEFTEATGFQFANISHWPIRRDRLRCLKAIQTGAMLKMKFIVPPSESPDGYKRELAITTHNSFGGLGSLWLDGDQHTAKIIKEENGQRRTQVNVLTKRLTPGVHTVTVYALQPGFCLSAVAVL
ncbi:uncharacterized protein LOC111338809 [Stylophora pistillata]|nr:uncharacterized protein LOC111338809 [Stylophora pistillata]